MHILIWQNKHQKHVKFTSKTREGVLDCGSRTTSSSLTTLVPPHRFWRILISRRIFFFLTGCADTQLRNWREKKNQTRKKPSVRRKQVHRQAMGQHHANIWRLSKEIGKRRPRNAAAQRQSRRAKSREHVNSKILFRYRIYTNTPNARTAGQTKRNREPQSPQNTQLLCNHSQRWHPRHANCAHSKARHTTDLEDFDDALGAVARVHALKHFRVFASSNFANNFVIVLFTNIATHAHNTQKRKKEQTRFSG